MQQKRFEVLCGETVNLNKEYCYYSPYACPPLNSPSPSSYCLPVDYCLPVKYCLSVDYFRLYLVDHLWDSLKINIIFLSYNFYSIMIRKKKIFNSCVSRKFFHQNFLYADMIYQWPRYIGLFTIWTCSMKRFNNKLISDTFKRSKLKPPATISTEFVASKYCNI